MKSLLLEETSKEDISHQKAVSQTEILLDRKHSKEIDRLHISKLGDSSNKSKLSSEEFRMSETFSGDEPSRALEITGKIKKIYIQCLNYDCKIVAIWSLRVLGVLFLLYSL